jgi:hypothetical protein
VPASLLPVVNRKLAMEKPTANSKVAFAANAAIASTIIVSLVAAVILVVHGPQPLLPQGEVDGASLPDLVNMARLGDRSIMNAGREALSRPAVAH